ncbi:MAG: FecR family protein, partial [Pollutimonas bauzanensis]
MNPEFHAPDGKIEDEARAWVRRLSSGRATKADARRLEQWCARSPSHQTAFERARQEWQAIGPLAQTYRSLYRESAPVAVKSPGRRWFMGAGLTAMGALTVVAAVRPPLGLWPSWSELGADYRTGTGEQRQVALSEHIDLTLNTQTSLAVESHGAAQRIRLIAGEAVIQRKAGAPPVEVLTGKARIVSGLGSIEVRRDDDRYCIRCIQGDAQLHHPSHTMALQAGEQVWYGPSEIEAISPVDLTRVSAWREGVVAFLDTPVAQAIVEINRYRPGRVVVMNEALAQRRLNGYFQIAALDEAI